MVSLIFLLKKLIKIYADDIYKMLFATLFFIGYFPTLTCYHHSFPISKMANITAILKSQFKISKNFQCKSVDMFLPIFFIICFGCSKEPSHWDGSFKYPQHMFWLRNKVFNKIWASAWDSQQCGMCDQQSLRPACAYAQTVQSLC